MIVRRARIRRRFADALTISVVGSRVGRWLPELLCRPGEEIVERLAILRDTDGTAAPEWITQWQSTHFKVFFSDPTLEPSLTAGNEDMVREILVAMNVAGSGPQADDSELPGWVAEWVKRKGKARKARFADSFAARCRSDPLAVAVPSHLGQLLDFVWDGFYTKDEADGKSANPEEISGE